MSRQGRAGLRGKWVRAVAVSPIGNAAKALLLYLAATCTTSTGYIDPPGRKELADVFGVHPQRIADRLQEGRRAGLIEQIDGTGVRGRRARYVATLPPEKVTLSGTHSGRFLTGERYAEIGTHSDALSNAQRYSQHARVVTEARQRDDVERDVGVSPADVLTERRQRREDEQDSSLAAIFRKLDGRRAACAGLRPRKAVAA